MCIFGFGFLLVRRPKRGLWEITLACKVCGKPNRRQQAVEKLRVWFGPESNFRQSCAKKRYFLKLDQTVPTTLCQFLLIALSK
jgi:hypothetical protein